MLSCGAETLRQQLAALPDWQSKYRHIIILGAQLPPLPANEKNDDNLIAGCESKVWLLHQRDADTHHFFLDSEAKIIRGLLAIVLAAIQDQRSQFIAHFDIEQYLQALGLAQHLSQSRSNGLHKVFVVIQEKIRS